MDAWSGVCGHAVKAIRRAPAYAALDAAKEAAIRAHGPGIVKYLALPERAARREIACDLLRKPQ